MRDCFPFFLFSYLPSPPIHLYSSLFILPLFPLYLFRPRLPLCCPLHIPALIPPVSSCSLVFTFHHHLFISPKLPSILHPLWYHLLLQSYHLAYISFPIPLTVSRTQFLLSDLPSLASPSPLLYIVAFFPLPLPLNAISLRGGWAFPPWHQFVGYHDNLLSQVIYSSRSAWLPHNTSCVFKHIFVVFLYICAFVWTSWETVIPKIFTWTICIQCASIAFPFQTNS